MAESLHDAPHAAPRAPGHDPAPRDVPAEPSGAEPTLAPQSPLERLDPETRADTVLAWQRTLGNTYVQRSVEPRIHARPPSPIVQRNNGPSAPAAPTADAVNRKADEVYAALNWTNEPARLLNALRGNAPATSRQIESAFQRRHDQSLRGYLRGQLWGERDTLVRAYALLYSTNEHEPHTALALALIPTGTRDAEVWRVLYGRPLAARRELESRYNEAFREIGDGSLAADLRGDLSGWAEQKALRLLYHDLTSAEELYFDSVGIVGTHSDAVVSRIQREWAQGPGRFAAFEQEWDQNVRRIPAGAPNVGEEAWTGMGLRAALASEMSWEGERWELVRAVLDGHDRARRAAADTPPGEQAGAPRGDGAGAQPSQRTEAQQFQDEEIRRQVARDTLTAATTGGYTGLGTTHDQVYEQLRLIRALWEGRIARARRLEDQALVRRYEEGWNREREQLRAIIGSEMDEGTTENRRSQLLLAGALTPADEVWLAHMDVEYDRVAQLATQYWATNRIGELTAGALESRRDGQGQIVRPSFNLQVCAGILSGLPRERLWAMIADVSQGQRGARRLRLEINQGDSDSDLRKAYDFLTTDGVDASLRTATINAFAANLPAGEEGGTPVRRFLHYIGQRYENSNTVWQFTTLLDPSTDPNELLRRAEGQYRAANTGVLNALLNAAVRDYDELTGEDTQQVTQESIERLRFIAQTFRAHPEELEGMLAMTGAADVRALAQMEFRQFQSRLDELRALKRSIADAIATAVEVAVAAALTAATGGVAGGALIVSLGSALAGMLVREGLQGQDYDLVSRQNAQAMAVAVASFGFGQYGQSAVNRFVSPERLREMGRAANFMASAAREASAQLGAQITTAAFEDRLPSAQEILGRAVASLGSAAGAGTQGMMQRRLGDTTALAERLRTNVMANVANRVVGGAGEEMGNLVREGTGNLTGADIALRFGRSTGQSIARGVVEGGAETAGQVVGARREARRAAALEPPEETPRPPAEGEEPSPRARQAEGEPRPDQAAEEGGSTRGGQAVHQGPTPPPIPLGGGTNAVIGHPVASETAGHAILRRLTAGDAAALQEIGVTPPSGYSPRGREWGLGRTSDGRFVVVQGEPGGIAWTAPALRGLEPLSHTHPWFQGRAMENPGHSVPELMARMTGGSPDMDTIRVMPSAEDIIFCGRHNLDSHEVHTPYVHLGGGRIGNPDPAIPAPAVTFRILRAEGVGFMDINEVHRARVVAVDSAGQQLWSGDIYAYTVMGRVPFLRLAQPEGMTVTDSRGRYPSGYRGTGAASGGPGTTPAGHAPARPPATSGTLGDDEEPTLVTGPPEMEGTPRASHPPPETTQVTPPPTTGNPVLDAVNRLRVSTEARDRNTARLVDAGTIRVRTFDDCPIVSDSVTRVRNAGYDPALWVVRRNPATGRTFMVLRASLGTVDGNEIIVASGAGADQVMRIVRHEAYHALRGDIMSEHVPGSLARYRDEFTAYWVDGSFDHIANPADRARAIREHVLRDYPDLREAYDRDASFRTGVDAVRGPERNVLNSPRWHMVEQQLLGETNAAIVLAALEAMPAEERILARNDPRLRAMMRIKLDERDYNDAMRILNST